MERFAGFWEEGDQGLLPDSGNTIGVYGKVEKSSKKS